MTKRLYILTIALSALLPLWASPNDTVYVVGGIQHESLFPTVDISNVRNYPRADWAKIDHLSNTYLDLGLRWDHTSDNAVGFTGLSAALRGELMEWPLLGYDPEFRGYGVGNLHLTAQFRWGNITVGDVYGQFGSGLILRLYEERSLGIDNALRGAKVQLTPYRGIFIEVLGGKQRRYWNMYDDHAWGYNYTQDAAIGENLELSLHEWIPALREAGANLMIGGSYVSKYQADDTIVVVDNGETYRRNLPLWVGAGDVRAQLQMKGWNALVEYAYKANDPCLANNYSYDHGEALLLSLSYSQKGLAVMAQAKRSENMEFRSDRRTNNTAGRLNHLPAFATQHTYALAALYPYATQMAGEWAFQGEVRYTWRRGTAMGGRYGTTLKLNAAHVRGLGDTWFGMGKEAYYTDVNLELNKKINRDWYIGAMLMYQTYNKRVVEGHGELIRSGIGVVEAKYAATRNVQMRAEVQYLYTQQDVGQWVFALYELSLYRQLMISAQWMYNIGYGTEPSEGHFYTVGATWQRNAHRLMLAYTKTRAGYNCSGGVCRFVPQQEGVNITYNFTW